jgi:hypothetical protein
MGVTLVAVVSVQPALGSTAAGLAGLLACWWLLPARGTERPEGRLLAVAAAPYVVLTVSATIGFAFPPVRALFERVPTIAPVLPGSTASFGFATADAAVTPAFRPLLHPLPYVLLAAVVGASSTTAAAGGHRARPGRRRSAGSSVAARSGRRSWGSRSSPRC